jgi:HSP20 family protein
MSRNPFNEIDALRREIDRIFEGSGRHANRFARTSFLPGRGARQYPMVNMYEEGNTLFAEALAPGVNPDTLEVSIHQSSLSISGEKVALASEIKPEAFHRRERATGKFHRTIDLPVEVDADKVEAAYENGLLLITMPRAEAARPKQIKIKKG